MTLATKTFHGTRAVLMKDGQELGQFESIETGVDQESFVPFVLGRASGGEVVLLGQAPIMVRLSGYRKIGEGPYSSATYAMNKLQDLIADNVDFTVLLYDRQIIDGQGSATVDPTHSTYGAMVAAIHNCKTIRHNLSVAAKQPARLSMELQGLTWADEEGVQSEIGTAY